MATICQTIEETLSEDNKPQWISHSKISSACHPGYLLNSKKYNISAKAIFFNTLGIIFALLATYLIVSTDSNLYLIFWVCYSALRRMIGKSKGKGSKAD